MSLEAWKTFSELNNIFRITKKNMYAFAQITDISEESKQNYFKMRDRKEIQFNFWVLKTHESTKAKV